MGQILASTAAVASSQAAAAQVCHVAAAEHGSSLQSCRPLQSPQGRCPMQSWGFLPPPGYPRCSVAVVCGSGGVG